MRLSVSRRRQKVAPPSRLAGGPPQISLQLKASEPSVRRAAVPFGKMNRPFGAGATGTAGNGTATENLVPREMAPIQEPEQIDEREPQPITESAPTPSTAADSQLCWRPHPGRSSEVSELASAPEWEFAPVRTETASTHESVVPARRSETPTISGDRRPCLDAPVTFEAPAPIEAVSEPATFETSEFFETVGEPIPIPIGNCTRNLRSVAPSIERIPKSANGAPVAQGSDPSPYQVTPAAFETPEFFETVSEPIPMPSETVAESVVTPAAEISEAEIEPVAQGQPIPYQVPAFSTDSPMTEITKPEPESHPDASVRWRRLRELADSVIRSSLPLSRLKLFPPNP